MAMLTLSQRECLLGTKYSGRRIEVDGKEPCSTLKLDLERITLDREECNALLGEPHAWESLFNTSANPVEPYLKCLKALELEQAWEGAHLVLYYEQGHGRLEFAKAKLSKLKLTLRAGGEVWLSLKAESEPKLDRHIAELIDRLGSGIEMELHAEDPNSQKDLPLSKAGTGEQAEGSRKLPRRSRRNGHSRRPAAH